MLLAMQDSSLDSAMFYDAQLGVNIYGGLFNPLSLKPFPTYYCFKGFGELYRLGTQVKVDCAAPDVYAVAAQKAGDGRILIANIGDKVPLSLDLNGHTVTACRSIDDRHTFESCDLPHMLGKNTVLYIETKA